MTLVDLSIPAFVLLIIIEAVSYRFLPDEGEVGYQLRDAATSIGMGIGSVIANLGWNVLTLAAFLAVYDLTPLRIPATWWGWALAFVAFDFVYYWQHRADHRVRILWASHVNHHSSRAYNLSTAVRQTWTGIGTMPFVLPMVALGFNPTVIFAVNSVNLLYQFWIHTERIGTMWGWFELVFNTPSHHRVHHATNPQYLDKNYAGVFIVFDRMFGTFEPEVEKPVYGLTKDIDTYNLLRVAFHEYAAIGRDLAAARGLATRLGILFRPPAWSAAALAAPAPADTAGASA